MAASSSCQRLAADHLHVFPLFQQIAAPLQTSACLFHDPFDKPTESLFNIRVLFEVCTRALFFCVSGFYALKSYVSMFLRNIKRGFQPTRAQDFSENRRDLRNCKFFPALAA